MKNETEKTETTEQATWVSGESPPTTEQPTPRRRGRPRKNPGPVQTESSENVIREIPKARRARKGTVPLRNVEEVDALAVNIFGIHKLLSLATGLAELEISKIESEMLADSLDTISREFGFHPSGKVGAVISMIGVCSIVYGPRYVAIRQRAKSVPAPANEPAPTNHEPPAAPDSRHTKQDARHLELIQQSHNLGEMAKDE